MLTEEIGRCRTEAWSGRSGEVTEMQRVVQNGRGQSVVRWEHVRLLGRWLDRRPRRQDAVYRKERRRGRGTRRRWRCRWRPRSGRRRR